MLIQTDFTVAITNVTERPIYGVTLRAEVLGQTQVSKLIPPNAIMPEELFLGDLAPHETVVTETISMTFDTGKEEPNLVWSLDYIDADGETRRRRIVQ